MPEVTAVPLPPLGRGALVRLWVALLVLALAAAGLAWWGTAAWQPITLGSGVRVQTLAQGHGPAITAADVFALNYRLHKTSLDGPVIQSTETSGQPFVGTVQHLFPGFGEGLQRMRPGGRYVLWLPPGTHIDRELGPGAPFSPRDTLVFEIEVLQVAVGQASAYEMQQLQQMMQMQQQQSGGAGQSGAPAPPAAGR